MNIFSRNYMPLQTSNCYGEDPRLLNYQWVEWMELKPSCKNILVARLKLSKLRGKIRLLRPMLLLLQVNRRRKALAPYLLVLILRVLVMTELVLSDGVVEWYWA